MAATNNADPEEMIELPLFPGLAGAGAGASVVGTVVAGEPVLGVGALVVGALVGASMGALGEGAGALVVGAGAGAVFAGAGAVFAGAGAGLTGAGVGGDFGAGVGGDFGAATGAVADTLTLSCIPKVQWDGISQANACTPGVVRVMTELEAVYIPIGLLKLHADSCDGAISYTLCAPDVKGNTAKGKRTHNESSDETTTTSNFPARSRTRDSKCTLLLTSRIGSYMKTKRQLTH